MRSCSGRLSRLRCHLHRGQTRGRRENGTPQFLHGRVPGSHLHAGTPGVGPHFLDPHTLSTPVLGGASEDWLVPGRPRGVVILHCMFGGCCPICSGDGPQASGHTSHRDHQAQAGQGYPSHPSCRPSATSSLDLVASGGQNPRAPEQRGRQTAPSVTQRVRQHSEGWGTLGPGDTCPARWGGGGSPQVPPCLGRHGLLCPRPDTLPLP